MRIDAHQHFWKLSERAGGWPPAELGAIYRDFAPGDLEPVLKAAGVGGTVVVQSLPSVDETELLLDLADRHDFILGIVGWVDLKAADAASTIERLTRRPKLRGLRPMLQDIEATEWIDDPAIAPAIAAMSAHRLTFDALVTPRHFAALTTFATRYGDLPIVIDHGGKPPIASGRYHDWRVAMHTLAGLPNVWCKLSGLLTEAGAQRPEAVRPYAETILELFGEDRTIWGSDWPVILLDSSYETWLSMCLDMVSSDHHEKIFATNAKNFYGLQNAPEQRVASR